MTPPRRPLATALDELARLVVAARSRGDARVVVPTELAWDIAHDGRGMIGTNAISRDTVRLLQAELARVDPKCPHCAREMSGVHARCGREPLPFATSCDGCGRYVMIEAGPVRLVALATGA